MFLYLAYLLCTVSGIILIKSGSNETNISYQNNLINIVLNPRIILGLFLYVISFTLWIIILRKVELTYAASVISSLSYILVMLSGFVFFHEQITFTKMVATVIILIGIILMNFK